MRWRGWSRWWILCVLLSVSSRRTSFSSTPGGMAVCWASTERGNRKTSVKWNKKFHIKRCIKRSDGLKNCTPTRSFHEYIYRTGHHRREPGAATVKRMTLPCQVIDGCVGVGRWWFCNIQAGAISISCSSRARFRRKNIRKQRGTIWKKVLIREN